MTRMLIVMLAVTLETKGEDQESQRKRRQCVLFVLQQIHCSPLSGRPCCCRVEERCGKKNPWVGALQGIHRPSMFRSTAGKFANTSTTALVLY